MFKQVSWIVALCAGLCTAQEGTLTHPEKLGAVREIEARIASIDVSKSQFTVKDTKDQTVTIGVGKDTTISSSGSSALTLRNLHLNDKVHIYYTASDHMARQIDVSPATPVLRDLGNP